MMSESEADLFWLTGPSAAAVSASAVVSAFAAAHDAQRPMFGTTPPARAGEQVPGGVGAALFLKRYRKPSTPDPYIVENAASSPTWPRSSRRT
jgi:hypothetical protein